MTGADGVASRSQTKVADALLAVGNFAAAVSWERQPADVREATQRVLGDSLAVMLAGGLLAESRRRRRLLACAGGPATVFGAELGASPCDAAWLNGCSLVALELDEGNKRIRGHATAHVLPAALALAEVWHLPGDRFATSFLAGHEVASRFGASIHLAAGLHPHGNWGVAGAAATTAVAAGASGAEVAAAIDAAASFALVTPFELATGGFQVRDAWIGHANAAGMRAWACTEPDLRLSTAATEVFGRRLGAMDPSALTAGLGEGMAITGGYLKRHSSCAYTHAPADAAQVLFAEHGGVSAHDVQSIVVETHHLGAGLDRTVWPSRMAAMFSIPFVVATALREGRCDPDLFDAAHRTSQAVADLARKVRVVHDPALDASLPDRRVARLRCSWSDGSMSLIERDNAIGDTDCEPLSGSELRAKASRLLGSEVAGEVETLTDDLLVSADVAEVINRFRMLALPSIGTAR